MVLPPSTNLQHSSRHQHTTDDSPWDKFMHAMSRFTANVEAVVAAFLLSTAKASSPPRCPCRRIPLPTGRVALRIIQERRAASTFRSIADDDCMSVDSDDETEGSEDSYGANDDGGGAFEWAELLLQNRFLDLYVRHAAALTIQRAFLRHKTTPSSSDRRRRRTPLASLMRLQEEIDAKHHAARAIQLLWRRHTHTATSCTSVQRLKRKRLHVLQTTMTTTHEVTDCRHTLVQDAKEFVVRALQC
ncbi:Aste57867_10949 [Aphanomyces stellatus]|uniref:Aste57867_10949 protein n=1 Tax=Aphanomyces stellatus TaxID=120398 RepID=A0A485KRQ0_9STRA|nr:hypothetical protein As57867_010909 [Aphanomyces stellatus]VFT87817.1 Aste57867_10949 [Aphanomyces stellatus]